MLNFSYNIILYAQDFCKLSNGLSVVANSQSIMMGGAGHHPFFNKVLGSGLEEATGVGVACGRNGSFFRVPFANDKFVLASLVLSDSHNGNGSLFQFEFHRGALARLAVILFETAEDGFSIGNLQVMWTIVTN